MRLVLIPVLLTVLAAYGCSMIHFSKNIPAPGGCNECHAKSIGNNWEITIAPATLSKETGEYSWQQPESIEQKQFFQLEDQKITELRCFRCHKGPDGAHTEYKGRYHN